MFTVLSRIWLKHISVIINTIIKRTVHTSRFWLQLTAYSSQLTSHKPVYSSSQQPFFLLSRPYVTLSYAFPIICDRQIDTYHQLSCSWGDRGRRSARSSISFLIHLPTPPPRPGSMHRTHYDSYDQAVQAYQMGRSQQVLINHLWLLSQEFAHR